MIYKVDIDKENYTQRNNEVKPHESCNVTSIIMALDYMGYEKQFPKGRFRQPEDNLRDFIENDPDCICAYENYIKSNSWAKNIPAPQIHDILSTCTNLWMKMTVTRFRSYMHIPDIINEIKNGRPVVINGVFQRPGRLPLDHFVILVGYNDKTQEVCYDDPYGKTYSWDTNQSGNDCWCSWESFIRDIKEPGNSIAKYAHTFYPK